MTSSPKSSIFDADEEKSKLLTRLLKSNHPEDLQAANRLIKNLVKEEQEKSEKVSKRVSAVEEVRSHVKVLQEMLSRYRRPGQAPPDQEALQVCFFFFFLSFYHFLGSSRGIWRFPG